MSDRRERLACQGSRVVVEALSRDEWLVQSAWVVLMPQQAVEWSRGVQAMVLLHFEVVEEVADRSDHQLAGYC